MIVAPRTPPISTRSTSDLPVVPPSSPSSFADLPVVPPSSPSSFADLPVVDTLDFCSPLLTPTRPPLDTGDSALKRGEFGRSSPLTPIEMPGLDDQLISSSHISSFRSTENSLDSSLSGSLYTPNESISKKRKIMRKSTMKSENSTKNSGKPTEKSDKSVKGAQNTGHALKRSVSCHQCKRSCLPKSLFYCGFRDPYPKRPCRKKYCESCVVRHKYEADSSVMALNSHAESNWKCPSCSSKCICVACCRKRWNGMRYPNLTEESTEKEFQTSPESEPVTIIFPLAVTPKLEETTNTLAIRASPTNSPDLLAPGTRKRKRLPNKWKCGYCQKVMRFNHKNRHHRVKHADLLDRGHFVCGLRVD
eukprot:208848_1